MPVGVERIDVRGIQERVPLIRHIVPGSAAQREKAPGPEVEVQPSGKALDALASLDELSYLRVEESVSVVHRTVGATEQPAREYPEAVVVVLR